jgi:hypothetical protein
MPEPISLTISVLALATSITTAWLTLLRRGTVRMTQPTVVYFGPDGKSDDERDPSPKVYLRTLLYCTSKRGRIIESLYVRLRRGETTQTFNIWVHGEKGLSRGSGLYVGQEGVAANHHFLLPEDGTSYSFLAGQYRLEVYASITGTRRPVLLCATELQVSESVAAALRKPDSGVYFDWGPDSARFHPHVRASAKRALPPGMIAVLGSSEAFGIGRESSPLDGTEDPSAHEHQAQDEEKSPNPAAGAGG